MVELTNTPTQVKRPWRATVRSVFQAAIALATLIPYVMSNFDIATEGKVAQLLAVSAVVTRIMADSRVEAFLQKYVPWLAATVKKPVA
jgi:predicted fused transcriptional regulator/phosphomethylpyrimidine kinase